MSKIYFFIIILNLIFYSANGQKQTDNLICHEQKGNKIKYVFINQKGDTVLRLDSSKFEKCFTDTLLYFAIVKYRGKKGFWAIDKSKHILFSVFDKSGQGIYPDLISCDMLRIVNDKIKIGYANFKGEIIVPPTFDYGEQFYKNTAIVGNKCAHIVVGEYETVDGKTGSKYEYTCSKVGYIDKLGKLYLWGKYSVTDLKSKLW